MKSSEEKVEKFSSVSIEVGANSKGAYVLLKFHVADSADEVEGLLKEHINPEARVDYVVAGVDHFAGMILTACGDHVEMLRRQDAPVKEGEVVSNLPTPMMRTPSGEDVCLN